MQTIPGEHKGVREMPSNLMNLDQVVFTNPRRVKKMSNAVKPISQTSELKGKYADQFLKDALKKPSPSAIERNIKAQNLLKKLKG